MNEPKVSIIVPIYNVEKYLRECLDSIVNQTYKNIEVIAVDDGSTDRSSAICDEYAQSDARVVVYHKKNGGLGSAYNYGVKHATGDYIAFVESDDWVEPNMIELLLTRALETNAEIVKAPFWVYDSIQTEEDKRNVLFEMCIETSNGLEKIVKFHEWSQEGVFAIEDHPELAIFHASLWSYLYKVDFVKQIHFVESPGAAYVDWPFVFEVLCRAKTIAMIEQPILHWRNDSQEHVHSTNDGGPGAMTLFDRGREAWDIVKKYSKEDVLLDAYLANAVHIISSFFFYQIRLEYKQEYWKKMRQFFSMFDDDALFQGKFLFKKEKELLWRVRHNSRFVSIWPESFKFSHIKRWIFSFHYNKEKGFLIQILGLQYSTKKYATEPRPALFAIRRP